MRLAPRRADAPLPAHANLAGVGAGRNCVAARSRNRTPPACDTYTTPGPSAPLRAYINIFTNLLQTPFPFLMNNAKPTLTHKSIFDIASHANGRPSVERRRSHGVGLGCGAFLSLSTCGVGLVGRTAMIDCTFTLHILLLLLLSHQGPPWPVQFGPLSALPMHAAYALRCAGYELFCAFGISYVQTWIHAQKSLFVCSFSKLTTHTHPSQSDTCATTSASASSTC